MATLREQYADLLSAIAEDYHRDFKHNANRSVHASTPWNECQVPRCQRFLTYIASFPGSLADETALVIAELQNLKSRVDNSLEALKVK